MRGILFSQRSEASHGDESTLARYSPELITYTVTSELCIDRKAHITRMDHGSGSVSFMGLRPCDGSCSNGIFEIPEYVEKEVLKVLDGGDSDLVYGHNIKNWREFLQNKE